MMVGLKKPRKSKVSSDRARREVSACYCEVEMERLVVYGHRRTCQKPE
jgi:hypothetical protein